jgi:hypothetical protein
VSSLKQQVKKTAKPIRQSVMDNKPDCNASFMMVWGKILLVDKYVASTVTGVSQ